MKLALVIILEIFCHAVAAQTTLKFEVPKMKIQTPLLDFSPAVTTSSTLFITQPNMEVEFILNADAKELMIVKDERDCYLDCLPRWSCCSYRPNQDRRSRETVLDDDG